MKWEYTPQGVVALLNNHHMNAYPDDIKLDWKLHYSVDPTRDAYVMVLQYGNPGRLGHLYSKTSIDGMTVAFCESAGAIGSWIDIIKEKFDQCRMDIIETLDEQITTQRILEAQRIKKQPQYIQEYPTKDELYWHSPVETKGGPLTMNFINEMTMKMYGRGFIA
jgi:hypothetical protein